MWLQTGLRCFYFLFLTKLGPHLFYPLSVLQPGLGAKRRPRNYPEELDRNYVVCCSCWVMGGEGGGGFLFFYAQIFFLNIFIKHKNLGVILLTLGIYVLMLVFLVFSKALLNVGEVEKGSEPAVKQPPQTAAGSCGCNKSCSCSKTDVVFSDLYSTGTHGWKTGLKKNSEYFSSLLIYWLYIFFNLNHFKGPLKATYSR